MCDEAIIKCKELSEKLDMNISINKQILGLYELSKSLDETDRINTLWNLLLYTDVDINHKLIFSREELELLSCIAREKAKINNKSISIKTNSIVTEPFLLLIKLLVRDKK